MDNIEGKILDDAKFRELVSEWARLVQAKARANIAQMTKGKSVSKYVYKSGRYKGKEELKLRTLSYKLVTRNGDLNNIKFVYPLHGAFVTTGVGRGQPSKPGKQKAKKIYINRSPNDFLNDPIENNIQKLADLTAQYFGDKVLFNVYGVSKTFSNKIKR